MKLQAAFLLLGVVAISSTSGYNTQLRQTLQPIPIARNYQQVAADPSAGAPGALFGAGAPGAPSLPDGLELPQQQQPVQVVYKAPTRIVERQPIRVVAPSSSYTRGSEDDAPRRVVPARQQKLQEEEEELPIDDEDFSSNAKYSFASAVDDGIQDQSQLRQETRDGHKVSGVYAYSDGFFKRTVNYEADENGYRVVSESVEPLSEDGPQVDLVNGKAEVHTQIGGVDTQYGVSAEGLAANTRKASALVKE